jgi:anti-anti-sigma factor
VIESVTEPTELEPTLQVDLIAVGPACRLVLHGDLCGATLTVLEAQVDQLGCMPCHDVVVDLGSLARLDSVGANVLLGLSHYVTARGGVFRITRASRDVAATLCAIATELTPTADDAFSAFDGTL